MLHTSIHVFETCSIYAIVDFRVISTLLFPPQAREDLHRGDQLQEDVWVGAGLGLIIKSNLNLSKLIIIIIILPPMLFAE